MPEKFDRGKCAYEGTDCFWLEFAGAKFLPENTDSISINGIPGIPDRGAWSFTLEKGPITAFSCLPFGDPDSAVADGKGYPLRKEKERKRFREGLKPVPEAYVAWNGNPLWAIRYFNRAGKQEFVSDVGYKEPGDDPGIVARTKQFESILLQKAAKNGNDAFTLGRLAEFHCRNREFGKAEAVTESLRKSGDGHFRYALVRAFCEEMRDSLDAASRFYAEAAHSAPPELVPDIFSELETIKERANFKRAYAEDAKRVWKVEVEFGLGFPYALLGAGVSLNRRVGRCWLAVSVSEGFFNVVGEIPYPVIGGRVYFPGEKFRLYLGVSDFGLYDAKQRPDLRYVGTDAGISWDIGEPLGMVFRIGVGGYHSPSYIGPGAEGRLEDPLTIVFPYLGFAHGF